MHESNVEEAIKNLGPASKIYFAAKEALVNARDSNSERFASAARIVRAFWMRVRDY